MLLLELLRKPIRALLEPLRPDEELERQERDPGDQPVLNQQMLLTSEQVDQVRGRSEDQLRMLVAYLEALDRSTLETHEHIVRKTLALVGWFTLAFAAFGIPVALVRTTQSTVAASPNLAPLVWLFAPSLLMLIWSLWGSCRVLWRTRLYQEEHTVWLAGTEFSSIPSILAQRAVELIEMVPINKAAVAAKARLYQGAVWSFFATIVLELASLMILALWVSA